MTPRDWGLASAAIALALDQGSKLLLLYVFHFIEMSGGDAIPVLPFFNLVMVWNPGVSYGLFPAHGPLGTAVLAVFSLGAVGALSLVVVEGQPQNPCRRAWTRDRRRARKSHRSAHLPKGC